MLIFKKRPISAQPLLGMDGSDAMALSMIVSIPDLAHTYMRPMETATSNAHASELTYSPQGCPFLVEPSVELPGASSLLSHYSARVWVIRRPLPQV